MQNYQKHRSCQIKHTPKLRLTKASLVPLCTYTEIVIWILWLTFWVAPPFTHSFTWAHARQVFSGYRHKNHTKNKSLAFLSWSYTDHWRGNEILYCHQLSPNQSIYRMNWESKKPRSCARELQTEKALQLSAQRWHRLSQDGCGVAILGHIQNPEVLGNLF